MWQKNTQKMHVSCIRIVAKFHEKVCFFRVFSRKLTFSANFSTAQIKKTIFYFIFENARSMFFPKSELFRHFRRHLLIEQTQINNKNTKNDVKFIHIPFDILKNVTFFLILWKLLHSHPKPLWIHRFSAMGCPARSPFSLFS